MEFFTNKIAKTMIDTFLRCIAQGTIIVADGHSSYFQADSSMNSRHLGVNRSNWY